MRRTQLERIRTAVLCFNEPLSAEDAAELLEELGDVQMEVEGCLTTINSLTGTLDTVDGMLDRVEGVLEETKMTQAARRKPEKLIKEIHNTLDEVG